jgi:hypothetical protein
MIAIALLFVRLLCDCFKSRRRLEAQLLVLRHQLNVLHQRAHQSKKHGSTPPFHPLTHFANPSPRRLPMARNRAVMAAP